MAYNKALARRQLKTAEEHSEENEKPQKKMEESDHNFRHEGPTGTKLIILLIIKEGGCIANSAPPVEYDDRFAAARSIAGKHKVSTSAARCLIGNTAPAAQSCSDTIQ